MIKIKDYIFNEKEIVSIELISGGLRVDLKSKSDYIDVYASFDDIEWNYGTPQETQRQMQKELCKSCYYRDTISNKLKDLEEEHKELVETNYNLATKKKELEDRINKAIEYVKEYYPTSTIYYQDEKDKLIKILRGEK